MATKEIDILMIMEAKLDDSFPASHFLYKVSINHLYEIKIKIVVEFFFISKSI